MTLPTRRRVGPSCLSDAQLDALVCDTASGPIQAAAHEHLASCQPCRRRHSQILDFATQLRDQISDTAILEHAARASQQRRGRWRRPAVAAAASVAVAAALVLLFARRAPIDPAAGIRSKGGDSLTVQVRRGQRTFVGASGDRYYPGDTLQFALQNPRRQHVAIFDREESGAVTVFHPWRGDRSSRVQPPSPGAALILEPAIALDEAPGREWLVAASCEREFATAPVAELLAHIPAIAVQEVTPRDLGLPAACAVQTFELDKPSSEPH